jgi:ABC-type Zn2+ transport system substrate-binding protein/surface adhesin
VSGRRSRRGDDRATTAWGHAIADHDDHDDDYDADPDHNHDHDPNSDHDHDHDHDCRAVTKLDGTAKGRVGLTPTSGGAASMMGLGDVFAFAWATCLA